jgi:16S rRNA (guanine966-N2)-methyltransferase
VRVVAGSARGRRLEAPPGRATRPTSDRAREGLFSSVTALGTLAGAQVLDLFCGSGAVGIEAVSRGARHALLLDSDARAVSVARRNAALVEPGTVTVVCDRAERAVAAWGVAPPGVPDGFAGFDLVFADPPYALGAERVQDLLGQLVTGGLLAPEALVVVERASRDAPFTWPDGITPDRVRRYGEGALWYGLRS